MQRFHIYTIIKGNGTFIRLNEFSQESLCMDPKTWFYYVGKLYEERCLIVAYKTLLEI